MDSFERRKNMVYELICQDFYKPMKIKELAVMLDVSKEDRPVLEQILLELQAEGKITLSKRGKYSRSEEKVLEGTFLAHSKGFGFVTVEGETEDIFIPAEKVHGAMHKDLVQISVSPLETGRRKEGCVLKILERGMKQVVCTYQQSKNFGFAVPDNERFSRDIFIPQEKSKAAVTGHKVVVEITNYGENGKNPEGKVIEILGHVNDPGVDILSIVKGYELPTEFSERVKNQVERVAKPVSEADMAGRLDLRNLITVTIDGEDSKDFDDAVSLTRDGENYILGVHIADVTNYVQEHSALDEEAKNRGTSVYLVDRVIPMLPFELSNGICSLNEGEDRLTLSCIMTIDAGGNILDHQIAESVIRSNRRMTYTKVRKLIEDEDPALAAEYQDLVPVFKEMAQLSALLRKKRMKRGAVDFDFPETQVILNESGKPIEICPHERNVATRLIEDFMLAANETVAEDFFWQEIPFLYRTHEKPDLEKVRTLSSFVANFGYSMRIGNEEVHPKEFQKLLGKIRDTEEEALLSRLVLRSMKQARYTPECTGHFGLAASYYCHFTSPIRRYPDLQIHRIIKETLRGRMSQERIAHYQEILPAVAKHSSETERRAEEAERETVKLKKVEYMEAHIGETYEGLISGVTEWGFFVELPNTVEGLIRVTALMDDFYEYREQTYELKGRSTGRSYKLGQHVLVRATSCDRFTRTVEFELA